MSVDLVSAIELLQEQKRDALAELARIDNELERARLAIQDMLGGRPLREGVRKPKPANHYLLAGTIPNQILAALAASEPRTLDDLAAITNLNKGTIYNSCIAMVRAGRLFRAKLHVTGKTGVYARSADALVGRAAARPLGDVPAAPEEGAADAG